MLWVHSQTINAERYTVIKFKKKNETSRSAIGRELE